MNVSKKRILLYALIGSVVVGGAYLFGACRINVFEKEMQTMFGGVLDATAWHPGNDVLSLEGQWEVYYNVLLGPEDFAARTPSGDYFVLPGEMIQEARTRDNVAFMGCATLRAWVRLSPPNPEVLYGIRSLYLASSYKIFIDGAEIASVGAVSESPEGYQARYAPVEAFFKVRSQDVEIIVQIANFHHRRVRLGNIWFGTKEGILADTYRNIISDSFTIGCLMAVAICYMIFFILNTRNPNSLWLSVIAFFTAMRGSIVNERVLIRLLPDFSPEWMMKLGYLPAFILLPLFILYIRYLYEADPLDKLAKALGVGMVLSGLFVLLTDIKVYDLVFEYTQWLVAAVGVYTIYILLKNRLITRARGGANVFLGGCLVLLAAINDTLRELNVINSPEMLTYATVLFILMQAVYLGWRLNDSFMRAGRLAKENERMVSEIQSMNAQLEQKVQLRTQELELANTQLERLARIDPLTQLANRRWFDERLEAEWERSTKAGKYLTLLMIDIDFFKNFNDTYGHIAGDECLQAIATELKRCVRNGVDTVARYGGEEFVALLSETNLEIGIRVANRMRKAVEELLIQNKSSSVAEVVTVSVGICSVAASEIININQLIGKADKALYRAKENGRNRVEIFNNDRH